MSGLLNQQLTALGMEYEMIKESEKFQVVIPQGVKTGGKFKVLVHGKHHILRCPQNKCDGEKVEYEIEIEKRVEKLPMATNITNFTKGVVTITPSLLGSECSTVKCLSWKK